VNLEQQRVEAVMQVKMMNNKGYLFIYLLTSLTLKPVMVFVALIAMG
jgi:hypothetical protein